MDVHIRPSKGQLLRCARAAFGHHYPAMPAHASDIRRTNIPSFIIPFKSPSTRNVVRPGHAGTHTRNGISILIAGLCKDRNRHFVTLATAFPSPRRRHRRWSHATSCPWRTVTKKKDAKKVSLRNLAGGKLITRDGQKTCLLLAICARYARRQGPTAAPNIIPRTTT